MQEKIKDDLLDQGGVNMKRGGRVVRFIFKRLLFSALIFPFLMVQTARAVSKPAGFIQLTIGSNSGVFVSIPFEPFNSALGAVFSNQLTGAPLEEDADRILKWDSDAQQYVIAFKADDTGDTNKDGFWFESGTNWIACTQRLAVGEGFWIENRHGDQAVYLGGQVVVSETQTVVMVQGLNAFAYPFSSHIPLNSSELCADGAQGGTNEAEADRVTAGVLSNNFWLLEDAGSTNDGLWIDATGGVATQFLTMGLGFWYDRRSSNVMWWTETRPYGNAFSINLPQVTEIAVRSNTLLTIACSGETGEVLEVFWHNLSVEEAFESTNGWQIAGTNLATCGQNTISWVHDEPVTNAFCRIYLVGREDEDDDGDGLSDGEEEFIYHTSKSSNDTDSDGLSDGDEVSLYGTCPLNPDTDGDGVEDGTEVATGTDPNNPDVTAPVVTLVNPLQSEARFWIP